MKQTRMLAGITFFLCLLLTNLAQADLIGYIDEARKLGIHPPAFEAA